jgi:hypothetical protein
MQNIPIDDVTKALIIEITFLFIAIVSFFSKFDYWFCLAIAEIIFLPKEVFMFSGIFNVIRMNDT